MDSLINYIQSNPGLCAAVGCVTGVCAGVVVQKWKSNKSLSQHSSAKDAKLDDNKAKLQELQELKEQLDDATYKRTTLVILSRILRNHRELFKLLLEDVERQREDNRETIQSIERLITESERLKATDQTEKHLREKQKLLTDQWRLERRMEELEKLQLNTEKQLQSEEAEAVLSRLTEKIKSLEKEIREREERARVIC